MHFKIMHWFNFWNSELVFAIFRLYWSLKKRALYKDIGKYSNFKANINGNFFFYQIKLYGLKHNFQKKKEYTVKLV